ncbi:MAG: phosphoribosylformylglycinamidine cyclo-ligase [Weeksellaceae bacterium]|nr:phosphoribosylformylglycinamidine cyclo-ligase [Weeksellaceae bacterium]
MSTYKEAGVDKHEGYKTVSRIKAGVAETHNENVLNEIGSFGAFYALQGYKNPVLVSGTDGVGTKLRIALDVEKYDTVGIDCFAMCANDILCHGAKPLFFLDYLACGKLDSEVAAEIIGGIIQACKETGCALIGGETAEMPGMYQVGDYDVAGFCVGAVERENIIDGKKIQEGDVVIALPSSGFHSNGFSLVRKVFTDYKEEFNGKPIYETLLTPTRLYQNSIMHLIEQVEVKGIAHITGGGIIENVPRILPKNTSAHIKLSSMRVPEIMSELQKRAGIEEREMYGTFNMGVGMVVVVSAENQEAALKTLQEKGEDAWVIGHITTGNQDITLQ